jgi:hypothetical protein
MTTTTNAVRPHPQMPPFDRKRQSLMHLRPRHLVMVEEHGFEEHGYNRDDLREYFLANWNRLFGTLRKSKALAVPSDTLRKEIMVHQLLDLIEMRRDEYAVERAARSF